MLRSAWTDRSGGKVTGQRDGVVPGRSRPAPAFRGRRYGAVPVDRSGSLPSCGGAPAGNWPVRADLPAVTRSILDVVTPGPTAAPATLNLRRDQAREGGCRAVRGTPGHPHQCVQGRQGPVTVSGTGRQNVRRERLAITHPNAFPLW